MKRVLLICTALFAVSWLVSCATSHPPVESLTTATSQASQLTQEDTQFFLHGSMGTEFAPEPVLRSFVKVYPDLFPKNDLSEFGLIPDPAFGWPIGFSRAQPAHLAGMSSVGINCASCHVGEVESPEYGQRVRVLGMTSHFDVEAFFNSVIVATFRTANPENMRRFLAEYLDEIDPEPDAARESQRASLFYKAWAQQSPQIAAAIAADPAGAHGAGAGGMQQLNPVMLRLNGQMFVDGNSELAAVSTTMLHLFHNMRVAVHAPDQPVSLPPASGPGRNDAFGLLSAALLNEPQPYAPVKYGLVWNLGGRHWVQWDGDTRSPSARNLLAAMGLGAPMIGKRAMIDYSLIQRQTQISEKIAAPKYPFKIDTAAAARGATLYQHACSNCHDGAEDDHRLRSTAEIWTDPTRARLFTKSQADKFNKFLSQLETPGYKPPTEPAVRSTQKYWAANLAGVWARSPYLHNGSVRTMTDLLSAPALRPKTFHRGAQTYDSVQMGYIDGGTYLFNTRIPGNANTGHDYGTGFDEDQKRDLVEYLKTL